MIQTFEAVVRQFDNTTKTATLIIPELFGSAPVDCQPSVRRASDVAGVGSLSIGDKVRVTSDSTTTAPKWFVPSTDPGPFLPLSGGTLTGFLTLNAAPTSALHAATKLYVDASVFIPSVYTVASEAAMLALAATKGDNAIRTDLTKTFILNGNPASVLANWVEIATPDATAAANAAVATHVALADPHTQYLLKTLAATTYSTPGSLSAAILSHKQEADPHTNLNATSIDTGTLNAARLPATIVSDTTGTAAAWTTARTLTLSGDLSGTVSIKGDAAMTSVVQVLDDSHTHDIRYYSQTASDDRFLNNTGDTMSSGALAFGSRLGQHLNLYSNAYGMGIQNSTMYFRTDSSFSWHFGGVHSDTANAPGTGGAEIMRLSDAAFTYKGNTVWHAGNDGSGSGLDADLLDAQSGSFYVDLANATGTIANARLSGSYTGITTSAWACVRLDTERIWQHYVARR
ncbi:MAG: hypothetical protein WKH64_12645 [Chloroflexia bacterium]